jgi:CheY-like chemotaxis protein
VKKVLIIEDDLIVANIYRNKFSVEGYQVEIARDGRAGLDLARSFKPDAVILDLMLPKLTGVELMKHIRADPSLAKVPVIVFSNTYLSNLVQDAWQAGATKCLSKSNCTPKHLLEVVRNALTQTSADGSARPPLGGAQDPKHAASAPGPGKAAKPHQANKAGGADPQVSPEVRKAFLESLPATLSSLRTMLQTVAKVEVEITRLEQLEEMLRRIQMVGVNARAGGISLIAQMADALETLLKELYERPTTVNSSSLRTVAFALDFLGYLFNRGVVLDPHQSRTPNVLVVDDEIISQRAVVFALEKVKLKATIVEDPIAACDLLSEKRFDLVVLDVDMPGMNGFELCSKLRTLPGYKHTPVMFVSKLNDFDARTNSTMSGGNEFIAKPFLFIEVAVKALVHILRGRLQPAE